MAVAAGEPGTTSATQLAPCRLHKRNPHGVVRDGLVSVIGWYEELGSTDSCALAIALTSCGFDGLVIGVWASGTLQNGSRWRMKVRQTENAKNLLLKTKKGGKAGQFIRT
jgi:hypothetical protein